MLATPDTLQGCDTEAISDCEAEGEVRVTYVSTGTGTCLYRSRRVIWLGPRSVSGLRVGPSMTDICRRMSAEGSPALENSRGWLIACDRVYGISYVRYALPHTQGLRKKKMEIGPLPAVSNSLLPYTDM